MTNTCEKMSSSHSAHALQLLDSRLMQLQRSHQDDHSRDANCPIPTAYLVGKNRPHIELSSGSSPVANDTSTWPSGATTPWEATSEEQTPTLSERPVPLRTATSRIEIRREERRKWRSTKKGVQVTTKYFYQEIDSSWTAVLIVACFFVSGLVDSVSFAVWSCFVSMQTGNTIFLALKIAAMPTSQHPLNFLKSVVSIVSYCAGALAFNCLHRAPTGLGSPSVPLHRWTLFTSFVIQSALLTTAAILAQTYMISSEAHRGGTFSSGTPHSPGNNFRDLAAIALLAFEAAGQVCLSRVLVVNELPTIVLSTLYHDLIGDALTTRRCWQESKTRWDFLVTQKKQIRRLASIIALFVGALIGGFVFNSSSAGLAAAMWLAAGTKIAICVAWCVWPRKMVTETIVTTEESKA